MDKENRANTDDVLFREMSQRGDRWDVKNKAYLGAKLTFQRKFAPFPPAKGLTYLIVR